MTPNSILPVDGNPDDPEPVIRAVRKGGQNQAFVVARDRVDALGCVFAIGAYAAREAAVPPAVILLDLKLPRPGGNEVPDRNSRSQA